MVDDDKWNISQTSNYCKRGLWMWCSTQTRRFLFWEIWNNTLSPANIFNQISTELISFSQDFSKRSENWHLYDNFHLIHVISLRNRIVLDVVDLPGILFWACGLEISRNFVFQQRNQIYGQIVPIADWASAVSLVEFPFSLSTKSNSNPKWINSLFTNSNTDELQFPMRNDAVNWRNVRKIWLAKSALMVQTYIYPSTYLLIFIRYLCTLLQKKNTIYPNITIHQRVGMDYVGVSYRHVQRTSIL